MGEIIVKSLKELFSGKYERITESGCWIWTGATRNKMGHGALRLGGRKGKTIWAHRASYELHTGEVPEGMCVCHRCDVPSCVNPDHLFLGTRKDNIADMVNKDRNAKGSKAKWAKITEEIALKIKKSTKPTAVLGEIYGLSRQSVADIRYGRTWKHV